MLLINGVGRRSSASSEAAGSHCASWGYSERHALRIVLGKSGVCSFYEAWRCPGRLKRSARGFRDNGRRRTSSTTVSQRRHFIDAISY